MEADTKVFKDRFVEEVERVDCLEDILNTMTQKFTALVGQLEERDRIVDKGYQKLMDCLDRHYRRGEERNKALKVALDKITVLAAQVKPMAERLCHCGGSDGSKGDPIEISDSEEDGKSLYAELMVAEESEEVPQVSGRLVVWTTTHLTLS